MGEDRRRRVGALGEQRAAEHLEGAGYRVIERNFRTRAGELDLVVQGRGCIVFCEVKTRVAGAGGPPGLLDAIGAGKRRRLRMMAARWLMTRSAGPDRPGSDELRFDAIGVEVDRAGRVLRIEHVENAF